MKLGISLAVIFFALLRNNIAEASDLDRLLRTGSCTNCTIENADLSGRSLQFNQITNTLFRNVDLSGSSINVDAIRNTTFENSDFNGSSLNVTSLSHTALKDVSLRRSSFNIGEMTNSSVEQADLANASVTIRSMSSVEFADFSAANSVWSFKAENTTFLRGQMDTATLAMTPTQVLMSNLSCRGCVLSVAPARSGQADLEIEGSDLTVARIKYGSDGDVRFTAGTILDRAIVNERVCSTLSVDYCL
jgi:uncharacterized protein YjbI with pentapeptide repeats